VVAACSNAARLAEGITARAGDRRLAAQVLYRTPATPAVLDARLGQLQAILVAAAGKRHPRVTAAGGGGCTLSCRRLETLGDEIVVFDLVCHPGDAMGANYVNDLAELLARCLPDLVPGQALGTIVSNRAPGRPATATARVPLARLSPQAAEANRHARKVQLLSDWAAADPVRAVTHNKGILNGIQGMMSALYQDTRALACALTDHAGGRGRPRPLATWTVDGEELVGRFEGPIVCGTAGGTGPHFPTTRVFHELMGISSAGDLEEVAAAVGLVQNLGALLAIATAGIQAGHMRLHARKEQTD